MDIVVRAYEQQFAQHGDCAQGFFWSRPQDAPIRLDLLSKVVREDPFSALDFGCGTGDLIPFLEPLGMQHYVGIEPATNIRAAAQKKYPRRIFADRIPDIPGLDWVFDYTFVSGTFNLKAGVSDAVWEAWVRDTLRYLWEHSLHGLAVNFLTYKPDWRREELWYPRSPEQIVEWIPRPGGYSILENYGLRAEWTLYLWR